MPIPIPIPHESCCRLKPPVAPAYDLEVQDKPGQHPDWPNWSEHDWPSTRHWNRTQWVNKTNGQASLSTDYNSLIYFLLNIDCAQAQMSHFQSKGMMASSNRNISALLAFGTGNSPVNSRHKGQRRGALMFSLICAWTDSLANNWDESDLRRYCAHYDGTAMDRL